MTTKIETYGNYMLVIPTTCNRWVYVQGLHTILTGAIEDCHDVSKRPGVQGSDPHV